MNNFDKQLAETDQLRDAWKRDPIYYFKPNKGGQTDAWDCTKQNQIILGGNRGGKSRLMFTKACAFMVPHPQDNLYAFWPNDLALRRQGLRIKLPVEIWISKRSYTDHQDVTMKYLWRGFEGKKDIPPLLKGRIRDMQFCPNNPDVWQYAVTTEGSRVTLKSEEAGKRSYEGAAVFAVVFDEACNPDVYQEGKMRVIDLHGYTLYGLTGAMAHDGDPSVWRNVVHVKTKILPLGNTKFQEIIYIPTIENPFIDYDFQVGQTEGMSVEEKLVRLTGQIQVATGVSFFNLDDLGFLRRTATEPKFIGTLSENFKERITDKDSPASVKNWAIYLTENEYSSFPLRIYHYPETSRQYAIGADVGGGGDPSAVVVMDDEWKICALQHGHIDEISLAIELSKLGRFYHNAWIAPEVNFPGNVTASWLWQGNSDLGLKRYSKIYRRTKSKYERRGQLYIPGSDIGWLTTGGQQGSRSELLAGLRELMIRAKREAYEDFILIPCGKFLDECPTFCLNPDGKYEALSGSHDDIIMATGIAIQCLKTYCKQRKIHSEQRQMQPAYSITDAGQLNINFDTIMAQQIP